MPPLLGEGGMELFSRQEVLLFAPDVWYLTGSVKMGYEIKFTHYLPQPRTIRPLDETRADILATKRETEGLMVEVMGAARRGW